MPTAARTAALSAVVQVTQDLQFLGTVNGLPSLQLGTYLRQFFSDSAQLQTTLSNLLGKLPYLERLSEPGFSGRVPPGRQTSHTGASQPLTRPR